MQSMHHAHRIIHTFVYALVYLTVTPLLVCTTSVPYTCASKYLLVHVTQPLIHDLMTTRAFNRLRYIHQYGVDYYCGKQDEYTRHEHSLRVYELLRRFGANVQEQMAGLFHDGSHTILSHVGDYVLGSGDGEDAYQDIHHLAILQQTDVVSVLASHGYSLEILDHKSGRYPRLEQPLPDLCADRIEYIITAGLLTNMITLGQAQDIVAHLGWDATQERWYLDSLLPAQQLGSISLYNTEYVWGCPESRWNYYYAAQAIKQALTAGIVTKDDVLYGTDDDIWSRLSSCADNTVSSTMKLLITTPQDIKKSDPLTRSLYHKFRGVDPWVKLSDGSFSRLTDIDPQYRQEFERVKNSLRPTP